MVDKKKVLLSDLYPDLEEDEVINDSPDKVLLSDLYGEEGDDSDSSSIMSKLASTIRGVSQGGFPAVYQMLPDFRPPTADVSFGDRVKVESLVSRPEERGKALESLGYNNVQVKGGRVYVDGKEFDPSTLLSGSELVHEAIANSPMLLEAQPAGGVASTALKLGGTALGVGSAREIFKKLVFPDLEPNPGDAAIEGVAGAAGGAVSGLLNKGASVADDIIDSSGNLIKKGSDVLGDVSNGQLVQKAKPVVTKFAEKTVKNAARNMFGEEATARELGATAQYLKQFGVKPITKNIEEAAKVSQRFVKEVMEEPHLLTKRDNALNILKEAGGKVRGFYDEYGDQVSVKLGDILSSKSYSNLMEQGSSLRHAPEVRKQIKKETGAIFKYLMEASVPDKKAREQLLRLSPDKFNKIASDLPIDIGTLWDVRMGLDDLAKWGSNIDDKAKAAVTVVRSGADAIRQSIRTAIENSSLDDVVKKEFADSSDLFHEMTPIAEMIDAAAAREGGVTNFTKLLWNQLSGKTRRVIEFGQKQANRPSTRAFIRSMNSKLNPDTLDKSSWMSQAGGIASNAYGKSKNVIGGLADSMSSLLPENSGQAIRSELFKESGGRLQDFSTPTDLRSLDINLQDIEKLAPQAPRVLPRDPELIASDPQALDELMMNLSPSAGRLLEDAIQSKDPFKLRNATLSAMSEVPEMFEPSVTGNRSEIRVGDGFILADPMEAEVYKRSLRTRFAMGKVTRTFLSKQISSLNDLNDMRLFPPAEGFPTPSKPSKGTGDSPLSGVKKAVQTLAGEQKRTCLLTYGDYKMKILAIEDNKTDRMVLEKAIKQANEQGKFDSIATIEFATNMHDALELLASREYDAIVTDLRLPDSEGLRTIEILRANTKKPLIIISGGYLKDVMKKALDGGVSRYITKGQSWTVDIANTIKRAIREDYLVSNIKRLVNV
jgi:CheY-like chemotaxis protein